MRTRHALLPLISLAAAVAVALPAQAGKPSGAASAHGPSTKTTTAAFTDTGDGFVEGTATCPAGQHVIAGGFSGSNTSDNAVVNMASSDSAWYVKGEFDAAVAKVFAYCSTNLDVTPVVGTTTVTAQTSGTNTSATARCPRGSRAVSGGWQFSTPVENSPVYTSAPSARKAWVVTAVNGNGGDWTLTSIAYCMTGVDATTSSQEVPIAAGSDATATATCATGRLIGGGFRTAPTPDWNNTDGPDTFHLRSSRASRTSWTIAGHNYSSAAGTMTAYARCMSKR
jgi:hypothetical protein